MIHELHVKRMSDQLFLAHSGPAIRTHAASVFDMLPLSRFAVPIFLIDFYAFVCFASYRFQG